METVWLGPVQWCPRYGWVRLRRVRDGRWEKTVMEQAQPLTGAHAGVHHKETI